MLYGTAGESSIVEEVRWEVVAKGDIKKRKRSLQVKNEKKGNFKPDGKSLMGAEEKTWV